MILLHELLNSDEIYEIINFLKFKKEFYWKNDNFDKFWHTATFLQSINYLTIDKRIFVDKTHETSFIMLKFMKTSESRFVNLEIWINDELSSSQMSSISNTILQESNENIRQNKKTLIRSLPTSLLDYIRMSVLHIYPGTGHYYNVNVKPSAQCLNTCLPSQYDLKFKQITEENVNTIINNWKFGEADDEVWITTSIKNFPSLGIIDSSTNEMIGQLIYNCSGTFGGLYIDKKYRGLGLAKSLIINVMEIIKQENMEFLIEIEKNNDISKCLFEKLEFLEMSKSFYVVIDKIIDINDSKE